MSTDYLDKLRSIATPMKKRGSHVYNSGGTKRTAADAVKEVKARNPLATQREMERAAKIEAMGAPSWQKCSEILQAGADEIGRQMEPDSKGVTTSWSERPAQITEASK